MPIIGPGGGGGGNLTQLVSVTLSSPSTTIDSGAGGFATSYSAILINLLLATDDNSGVSIAGTGTFNNDSGAHYDYQQTIASTSVVAAGGASNQTSFPIWGHGATGTTSYAASSQLFIPGYGQTTFFKSGVYWVAVPDATAANIRGGQWAFGWQSTTAISRFIATATSTKHWIAGSSMQVYGMT